MKERIEQHNAIITHFELINKMIDENENKKDIKQQCNILKFILYAIVENEC